MPAYEYHCDSCDGRFEARQKMSDRALDVCPQCGGPVRRLISGGAGAITRGDAQASSYPSPCGMGNACCGQACMGGGSAREN